MYLVLCLMYIDMCTTINRPERTNARRKEAFVERATAAYCSRAPQIINGRYATDKNGRINISHRKVHYRNERF